MRCGPALDAARVDGMAAAHAIVFMHGYRPSAARTARGGTMAREIGFPQVSVSHEISPLIKLIGRGDTTVVDAYLSPILRKYVERIAEELSTLSLPRRGKLDASDSERPDGVVGNAPPHPAGFTAEARLSGEKPAG